MFGKVLRSKKEEMLITLFVLFIMLVVASSLMYYIEKEAQPNHFSSILAAMWWGVATLTTVGYGDVFPVTSLGKLLSAFMAVLGIGIFALPTGILASGFIEEIQKVSGLVEPTDETLSFLCSSLTDCGGYSKSEGDVFFHKILSNDIITDDLVENVGEKYKINKMYLPSLEDPTDSNIETAQPPPDEESSPESTQ